MDDPLYHYHFDLRLLQRGVDDYTVTPDVTPFGSDQHKYTYSINMCAPIKGTYEGCDKTAGVGVCQVDGDSGIDAGKYLSRYHICRNKCPGHLQNYSDR